MKIPLFDKVMGMVEDAEKNSDFIIFVLVSPRDYKDAVRNAGNIAVTVGDRLKLDHAPLVAVRNDLSPNQDPSNLTSYILMKYLKNLPTM